MNKKKIKSIVAGISVAAVVGVAGIVAYFTDTVTVTNHATMGIVDIDLVEYTIDENGDKVAWSDVVDIVPGDTISKIPEIGAVEGSADCYVRAKVQITCRDESMQADPKMLTLDNLNVDENDWYYCEDDGYFYYKNVLKASDDPVVLFTEVSVPSNLGNTWALEQFSIDVIAEAIQSQNYTPDFSDGSTNPWPGITASDIEECVYPTHVRYDD